MAPPISFGLGLSLARAGGAALDADAAAYIAAVETAGATVSGTQKAAIDTFFKTGKSDGWYSSIKRMYLTIWSSAAPNAVDMVTRASGTYNGTVTHSAGYVKGDGSTGYFDFGSTPSTLGLLTSSGSVFALHKSEPVSAGSRVSVSSVDGTDLSKIIDLNFLDTSARFAYNNNTDGQGRFTVTLNRVDQNGIFVASRFAGNRSLYRRDSTSISTVNQVAGIDYGTIPVTSNMASMRSQYSTGTSYSDAEFGAYGAGLGFSDTQTEDFTLALKDLWETATGLTLP